MFPRLPIPRRPFAWLPVRRFPLGLVAPALLAAALGCSDGSSTSGLAAGGTTGSITGPASGPAATADAGAGAADPHPQLEQLARRMARALKDPAFRAYVKSALDASPYLEHKLQFQRFLDADGGRARRELARLNDLPETTVAAEARAAIPLEMYFPVPAHRAAWEGGTDLLVATAVADADAPVAYDLEGHRRVLSASAPPATPVLAVEPVETDFDAPASRRPGQGGPAAVMCTEDCGTPGTPGTPPPPGTTGGLFMTASHLTQTFESWLKGSPEIEILVLGQKGATDSLTKYQCIGERSLSPYYFDQNDLDWRGSVMMFSQAQLDAYKAQHPGQSVRLFFMEDDDTSCEIRNDPMTLAKLIGQVDAATRGLSGGRDTTSSTLGKFYRYALAVQKLYAVAASLIKTNDDLIGNAVEDKTVVEFHTGYNWVIRGENNVTNGWINLQMQ